MNSETDRDAAPSVAPLSEGQIEQLYDAAVTALRTVYDPEIPVNIYDMGLIYHIEITPPGAASVRMTLTSPNCPAAESLPADVKRKVSDLPGITSTNVEIVWDPQWTPEKMTEAARLELGMW
ncbi:MAG: DUF59 domain-containing protein [Planctomycetota bacterium]